MNGAHEIYGTIIPQVVLDRIEMEMDVIIPNKFTDYILMIWDIHDFCKTPKRVREFCTRKGITPPPDGIIPIGPGRGSVGGSMVCYCINIHECDPILFGLFFERFLNPERIAYPDIDFDISQRYRHIGIAYIADIYGEEHVAQIITYGTLAKNTVVLDVLSAANVSGSMIKMVKDTIPDDPSVTLSDIKDNDKFLKAMQAVVFPDSIVVVDKSNIVKIMNAGKYDISCMSRLVQVATGTLPSFQMEVKSSWSWRMALDIMLSLEGLSKNESTHAAGVVVAPVELESNVPLFKKGGDGVLSCQYDMVSLEALGFLKMDALGLRTVDVNHNAEALVRKWYDPDFNIRKIPYDDADAIKSINNGDTVGIFQIESTGFTQMMKDLDIGGYELPRSVSKSLLDYINEVEHLRGININDFMWISAGLALYRPGPLDAVIEGKTMVKHLIDRKSGKEPIAYLFPEEKDYLEETYGVLVYQEQVMARVRQMTGCSYGRADTLRKAMGKKDQVLMKEQMDWFKENAMKCQFSSIPMDTKYQQQIVDRAADEIEKFARYGFNKAHTVEYAHICYRNAYLKAHYPDAFYASILNSETDAPKRQVILIRDMLKHEITLLPPTVNESDAEFTMISNNTIRFGLGAIKNVGDKALPVVIEDRDTRGKYKSVEEFRIRIPSTVLNVVAMENLAKCGAFDDLIVNDFDNRATLFSSMRNLCEYIGKFKKKKNKLTPAPTVEEAISKWENSDSSYEIVKSVEDVIQYSIWEKEILKYYISAHPIDAYTDEIRRWGSIEDIDEEWLPDEFYIVGFVESLHETIVKKEGRNKGKAMGFVTIGTAYRTYEATMFPGIYESCLSYLKSGNVVVLKGKRNVYQDKVTIQCEYVRNISNSGIRDCPECHMRLNNINDIASLYRLKSMFDEHPGTTTVFIHVESDYNEIVLMCRQPIALNDRIIEFIESVGELAYKEGGLS